MCKGLFLVGLLFLVAASWPLADRSKDATYITLRLVLPNGHVALLSEPESGWITITARREQFSCRLSPVVEEGAVRLRRSVMRVGTDLPVELPSLLLTRNGAGIPANWEPGWHGVQFTVQLVNVATARVLMGERAANPNSKGARNNNRGKNSGNNNANNANRGGAGGGIGGGGTCCITCGDLEFCACAVSADCGSCCEGTCCNFIM
jgi:hypothetical protein